MKPCQLITALVTLRHILKNVLKTEPDFSPGGPRAHFGRSPKNRAGFRPEAGLTAIVNGDAVKKFLFI